MSFCSFSSSSERKSYFSAIPSSSCVDGYGSFEPVFDVSRLPKTRVLDVLESSNYRSLGHIAQLNEVSLSRILDPVHQCVGLISAEGYQLGSCSLISEDLAIVACHSIEGLEVNEVVADFGFLMGVSSFYAGVSYKVKGVVEHDPDLDYAIVQLEGYPGRAHGFFTVITDSSFANLALLHHPLSKPLQVSVHDTVPSDISTYYMRVFHDTDYGSSGGGYINPEGKLAAIHIGSSLDFDTFALQRVSLPIASIVSKCPTGIINQLQSGMTMNPLLIKERLVTKIEQRQRSLIDVENFDRKRMIEYGQYLLRDPIIEEQKCLVPGVIIEAYQIKHTPNWPGSRQMGKGSSFNLSLDQTIELALKLVECDPVFKDPNPPIKTPGNIKIPVDKNLFGQTLYKALKDVATINIYAAFNEKRMCWEIHFYPVK